MLEKDNANKKLGYRGLSLAEIIVAIAILAITLFSLLSVLVSGMQADKKAFLLATASNLADTELERAIQGVAQADQGTRDAFWNGEFPHPGSPYRSGTRTVNNTQFDFSIHAVTVFDTSGVAVGDTEGDNDHRLKQLDIYVRWYESSTAKLGQGQTVHHQRRLITEVSAHE